MANMMTNTQYQSIKNETYTVVKFKGQQRVLTVSNCSFFRAMEEVMNNRGQYIILVINQKDLPKNKFGTGRIPTNSFDIKDYEEYFKMEKKLF